MHFINKSYIYSVMQMEKDKQEKKMKGQISSIKMNVKSRTVG